MSEKHKYGSPEDVAQRILEWLGQNARQDATSLLLYEAMQALKKYRASPADQVEDVRDACQWHRPEDDCDMWETECGTAWSFIDGGPAENGMHFCHNCGKRLVIYAAMSASKEGA